MTENNDITQDRGNGIRRDSNMDIASLIKTTKTNTAEAPVAEKPVEEEAPRPKTPLEQMKEQKANETKGLVVDNADLNHDQKALKNKTETDATDEIDRYMSDMDKQMEVAKKIKLSAPIQKPEQMVGLMDALDRASNDPSILEHGEVPDTKETPSNETEKTDKSADAEDTSNDTPVETPDPEAEAKAAADAERAEMRKKVVEILIDKTGLGAEVNFTDDEKEKLTTSTEIRVKEIEDVDLSAITIKKADKSFAEYVNEYQGSSSRVPVTFPASRFRAYMTGLSYGEMGDIIMNGEAGNYDRINKQLSIIYNKMVNPSCGKFENYEDFLKKFAHTDINIAIYGLIIATFPEIDEISLNCNNPECKQSFYQKFAPRSLIQFADCDEKFLDAMKEVIDCPAGKERELMANGPVLKNKRVQLPQSKYILEIGVASAYDYLYTIVDNIAGDVFEENHPNDVNGILKDNAGALTMVRAVYVPNPDGTWTMYDKFEDMVEAIYSIKPDEITLVASLLQRYMRGYTAQFALTNVRCPHCGQLTKRIPIDVTYLVFLKYQRLGNTSFDTSNVAVL
jgi:hypothetical protein